MKNKYVVIYSPSTPLSGFGPPTRYQKITELLLKNGYKVETVTSCHANGKLPPTWYRSSILTWIKMIMKADTFICSPVVPAVIPLLLSFTSKNVIIDYYAPDYVEFYDKSKNEKISVSDMRYNFLRKKLLLYILTAKSIIVSSQKQKIFLEGIAYQKGLLNRNYYNSDKSFKDFFPIIPYGFDELDISSNKSYGKKHFPRVDFEEPVFVWGGGVWNWFDPFTLIDAIKVLKEKGIKLKLIFPGFKSKPSSFMDIECSDELYEYIIKQEVEDFVDLNNSYIPYDECLNVFSLCNAGICTAFDSIENSLSFRTRIINYIASGLPIISTKDDPLSDIVEKYKLGITVAHKNKEELLDAIVKFSTDNLYFKECKDNIKNIEKNFRWNVVLEPLLDLVRLSKKSQRPKKHIFAIIAFGKYFIYRVLFFLLDYKNIFGRMKAILSKH